MPSLLLLKICSAAFIVLSLAWVTERISPRAAGVLSGFPLGALLVTFFVGIEQGPQFGSDTALAMVMGLSANVAFLITYWFVSSHINFKSKYFSIALTATAACGSFLAVATLLSTLPRNPFTAVCLTLISATCAYYLFRQILNIKVQSQCAMSFTVISIRALSAIAVVLTVTELSRSLGPYWSGLFASFPITLFPVLLVVHASYSAEHTWAIIKGFPLGVGCLVLYGMGCSYFISKSWSTRWYCAFFDTRQRVFTAGSTTD